MHASSSQADAQPASARRTRRVASLSPLPLPWHQLADHCLECSTRPLLLVGPPGCGKSTYAFHKALQATGRDPIVIHGGPQTEERHIWADRQLDASGARWVDGPLPRALKEERWLIVEEINQIPPEIVGQFLQLRRDDHQQTILNLANGEVIEIPDGWRTIFTANPGTLQCFSARRSTPVRALFDGCLIVEVPTLNAIAMRKLLEHRFGKSRRIAKILNAAVEAWSELKNLAEDNRDEEDVDDWLSFRALSDMVQLMISGLPRDQALEVACIGKFLTDKELHNAIKLKMMLSASD